MSKNTILVTGGLGYLGSYLSEYIISAGYNLIIIDRGNYPRPENFEWLNKHAIIKIDDISKSLIIGDSNIMYNVKAVVHLAALVGEGVCDKYEIEALLTNHYGTSRIVEQLKDQKIRMIFPSTCSNYGISKGLANERSPLKPLSIYAKTKVSAESVVSELNDHVIIRFGTLFGRSPRMRWDLMLNEWAWEAHHYGKIQLYNPNAYRPLLHLLDACQVIMEAVENKSLYGIYNVACGNFTKLNIAKMVQKEYPCSIGIVEIAKDKRNYQVDFSKLGYKADINLSTGLKELRPIIHQDKTSNEENFKL